MSRFEDLGRDVAEALRGEVDDAQRLRQRQALIEHASAPASGRGRAAWAWPGITAVAVASALALWLVPSEREASPRVVGATPAAADAGLQAGMYLSAPEDRVLEIEVAGGGKVSLSPGARGRVSDAADDRVELVLEGGAMEAVAGDEATEWQLQAGPVSVLTSEAVFRVEWDPQLYLFRLHVREGQVQVRGGRLGEDAMTVRAGETFEMDQAHANLSGSLATAHSAAPDEASRDPQAELEPAPALTSDAEHEHAREPPLAKPDAQRRAPAPVQAPARWWVEAEQGHYREALRAAEAEGFSRLVRELGPEPLKKLADTARLARNADRAREALTALRDRHPDAPQAVLAAFLLGRVAFDLDRDYVTAAHWFTTYEAESPRGRFAAEARGRVIDALERSGDHARAKRAAELYLRKHPDGSYATLAQSVLED